MVQVPVRVSRWRGVRPSGRANTWPSRLLTTCQDVEDFINENGHMPGIPSSKVIEEDGISVGEMNRLMMEKIEELTLHVIELEKEIKNLKVTK